MQTLSYHSEPRSNDHLHAYTQRVRTTLTLIDSR